MGKQKKEGAAEAAPREEARTVLYVVNRPYSAGEAPEIVEAVVKREDDEDKDVLDLKVGDETIKGVRRDDRRTPGAWFKGKA